MAKASARIRLSWDVYRFIFESTSDVATLAALGGVSFDFLAGSSKFLYERVELNTVKKMEGFFCRRIGDEDDAVESRIHPHLSLAQTRFLHVDLTSLSSSPRSLNFQRMEEQWEHLLRLDTFRLSFHYRARDLFELLHRSILPYLNPKRFQLLISGRRPTHREDDDYLSIYAEPVEEEWDRLETLELAGDLPFSFLRDGYSKLTGVRTPSLGYRLHVATLLKPPNVTTVRKLPQTVVNMEDSLEMLGLKRMQPGAVVLLARSEKEREECEKGILDLDEKWRSFFAVELMG